jgi:hypothetical protein
MTDFMDEDIHQDLFRPTQTLTVLTIIGLSIFALLDLMYVPGGIVGMYGVGVFNDGVRDQDLVDISMLIRAFSALGQLAIFLFVTISFCMLMYRCAKNARALGFTGFSHTPGWVVGWYFVPFAHLIMPYKAIAEVWQSSKAKVEPGVFPEWFDMDIGFLLRAWWAAWIFGTLANNTASRMSRSTSFELIGMCMIPFAAVLQVVSAILCIVVVYRLTKQQSIQAQALKNQTGLEM